MKSHCLRFLAVLCAVLTLCLCMTACFTTPDVVIDSNTMSDNSDNTDNSDPTENTEEETTPTVAVPKGQLSLSLLMGVMSSSVEWSELSVYDHTVTDDTHATFAVADGFGKTCDLNVTFDAEQDRVTEATLSYQDTSVNVLTDDTLVIRTIMIAMNQD